MNSSYKKIVFSLLSITVFFLLSWVNVQAAESSLKEQLQAKQSIADRKAAFTLIHSNFKPLGDFVQGKQELDAVKIKQSAERLVFLTSLLAETFPANSNLGTPATKSKAEVWSSGGDFQHELDGFSANTKALMAVAAKEKYETSELKKAVMLVGQNCKSCHDKFKEK